MRIQCAVAMAVRAGLLAAGSQAGSPAPVDPKMLHEAFHTLGLGENPPSSAESSIRVAARCRH